MNQATPPNIKEWERALSADLDSLILRKQGIEAEIRSVSKKLELVRQMVALEGSGVAGDVPETNSKGKATPASVREAARQILKSAVRPLHINEIHTEFLSRGDAIPGVGTPFNILVHLLSDPTFVRVARGTYALSGTVPDDQVLPRQPRRAKVKPGGRTRKKKGK